MFSNLVAVGDIARETTAQQHLMSYMEIYKYGANSMISVTPDSNNEILPRRRLERTWNIRSNELKAQVAST